MKLTKDNTHEILRWQSHLLNCVLYSNLHPHLLIYDRKNIDAVGNTRVRYTVSRSLTSLSEYTP